MSWDSGRYEFSDPSGVAFGLNGEIYVADGEGRVNARIVKFTKDGKFVTAWGTRGSGRDNLDQPHAIAVDSTGRVFVADRRNNRVIILDADLQYVADWRQFGRPSGLAIDRNDILYVTDSQTTDGRPGISERYLYRERAGREGDGLHSSGSVRNRRGYRGPVGRRDRKPSGDRAG